MEVVVKYTNGVKSSEEYDVLTALEAMTRFLGEHSGVKVACASDHRMSVYVKRTDEGLEQRILSRHGQIRYMVEEKEDDGSGLRLV